MLKRSALDTQDIGSLYDDKWRLAPLWQGIKAKPVNEGVEELEQPYVVFSLAYDGFAVEICDYIALLPKDKIVRVLKSPGAVFALAHAGQAKPVLALMEDLPQAGQAAIFATPQAVQAMAEKGCAAETAAMIAGFTVPRERAVISATMAEESLRHCGQSETVEKIMRRCERPHARANRSGPIGGGMVLA